MAASLAAAQPAQALCLVDDAFAILHCHAAAADGSYHEEPAVEAGPLLQVAARIDPLLVRELFWSTVALGTRSWAKTEKRPGMANHRTGTVALVIARYDHRLALDWVELALTQPPDAWRDHNEVLAAARVDPRRAVALLEAIAEPDKKERARRLLIEHLTSDEVEFPKPDDTDW
jgi:hypothetical protein